MSDCVIDTHVLGDLISQFNPMKPLNRISESKFISKLICDELNKKILLDGVGGLIVASGFAFVEIANKFEEISNKRFKLERFCNFLTQPPNWFLVEPLGIDTTEYYAQVPKYSTKNESIELTDAFHAATAIQRGPRTILATSDHRLHDTVFADIHLIR